MIEEYTREVIRCLKEVAAQEKALQAIATLLCNKSGTTYIAGNGGSSSTAQHFAQGLLDVKVRAVSLTDNVSNLTALSNDIEYSRALIETLERIATPIDRLVVISGSGSSRNVLEALKIDVATKIGLLGFGGGAASKLCDVSIVLSSKWYGPIEDIHLVISHVICELIKERTNKRVG
jgi:D-sedoheptulose 7-phosphate isomerase